VDDAHTLVVKISDPEHRKSRVSPADEGRELFVVNIDFDAKEPDVRELFSKVFTPFSG
jgi:squamous cell carcinoma antigen recognized by T-cells 3